MSTFSRNPFSGSTNGKGVKVAATAIGSGTTVHTASASATLADCVTIFAYNSDTTDRILTLGWGGTTDPDDLIKNTIPTQAGLILVVADLVIYNSLVVKAAADVANKVILFGYVNGIT